MNILNAFIFSCQKYCVICINHFVLISVFINSHIFIKDAYIKPSFFGQFYSPILTVLEIMFFPESVYMYLYKFQIWKIFPHFDVFIYIGICPVPDISSIIAVNISTTSQLHQSDKQNS